jgi:hypothetical protein
LIFRGGPITSVTRLDHAGITVPFLGEKRPQVSVRVTPGIVVVPLRLRPRKRALGCSVPCWRTPMLWPGVMLRRLHAFRVSPGYGIWMLLQPLGGARKPRSGAQTWGTGRSRTASVTGLRDGSSRPSKGDAGSESVPAANPAFCGVPSWRTPMLWPGVMMKGCAHAPREPRPRMPPQPLGVARKPRSVLQTAIRLGGYLGTGRSRTARRGLLGEICPASRSKPEGGKEQA